MGIDSLLLFVVAHQGQRIRELIAGLTLRPVDDLQHVSSGDVVGVGPAAGRGRTAAVQVDAEPRIGILPAAVALVDLDHLHRPLRLSHVSDRSKAT